MKQEYTFTKKAYTHVAVRRAATARRCSGRKCVCCHERVERPTVEENLFFTTTKESWRLRRVDGQLIHRDISSALAILTSVAYSAATGEVHPVFQRGGADNADPARPAALRALAQA